MIIFEYSIPLTLVVTGSVLATFLTAVTFWKYLRPGALRIVLAILRTVFLVGLVTCLLLPARKSYLTRKLKPHFLVMIDRSASMEQPRHNGSPTRWEGVREMLGKAWYDRVGADCDLDIYTFDTEPDARLTAEEMQLLRPAGKATFLRHALQTMTERYRGQEVAGCLLLSDGIDTREPDAAWTRDPWPWPIYSTRLAPELTAATVDPDIRVDTINTPRRVSVGWNSEFKALVSGQGASGKPFAVQLYENNILIQERPVQLPARRPEKEVSFNVRHTRIGTSVYRVSVPPLEGETHTNDNSYAVSVQVVDARNRLLYVEGSPRWESKYLVRTLKSNPQVTPVCFIRGPDNTFMTVGPVGDMTPDMTDEQLALFKIVILGNLDAAELGPERAGKLVRFVEAGGSLVLLGGTRGWGKDGFIQTPLRQLLPVSALDHAPRQDAVSALLTDDGLGHPAFAGDVEFWSALPPILSFFAKAKPSPGAQTLVAVSSADGMHPVIVSRQYGQGKVAAILTDSLWRWHLSPAAAESKPYQRFWNQLTAWLSPTEQVGDGERLDVFLDRDELYLGESVVVSARLPRDEAPSDTHEVICRLGMPDGRTLPFAMSERHVVTQTGAAFPGFGVTIDGALPGLHTATVILRDGADERASDTLSFFVKPFTPESAPVPTDTETLQLLARHSEGAYLEDMNDLDDLLSDLEFGSRREERVEFRSLWQNWWVLSFLLGFLCLEWTIRKWKDLP